MSHIHRARQPEDSTAKERARGSCEKSGNHWVAQKHQTDFATGARYVCMAAVYDTQHMAAAYGVQYM